MNNIRILSLTGAVLTGAAVFWEFSFGVLTANHIYDVVIGRKCSFLWYLIPVFFALAALWGMRKKVVLYEYALRPLWLTSVILFFNLFCTEAFCYVLAVFSWSAFRLGSLVRMPFSNIKFPEMKWAVYSVILLTILTLWNSFYIQDAAFKALYLVFGDWGQYAECYLQLASGSATLKQWLVSAGHCNGLVNLIMAAAIALVPSPRTIFFVNAAVLASALPLSFLLARCSALKPGTALLCAGLAAVYPIFTRQSLCLFYGFHPIVFFIPLLLCFFIARSKKSLWGMTVCVVLSLFVQETVAIFWIGWGLYLFAVEKKFLAGTLLALGMAGWFAFLTLFLQPWGGDAQVYAQSFRYAALGSSPLEIAMSPFCKPAVFWSFFFSLRNITFAALILVPSLFAVIPFPAVLLTGLPLLGGFFMQSSEAVKTPLLQYGVELGTLCWALAIVNLGRLYKGEKSWLSGRGRIFNGTLCALTAGILIGYIYFGYGYKFGLYPGDHCYFGEDASKSLNFLKKHLPEKLPRLLAAQRVRAHFMFDFPTEDIAAEYRTGDWLLIDLNDPAFDPPGKVESLRHRLYNDPRCRPVTYASWYGKQLVLIEIAPPGSPRRIMVPHVPEEFFNRAAGLPLQTGMKEIQGKYDGRQFHFRLRERVKADYDLTVKVTLSSGVTKKFDYSWYFGLFPAWAHREGALWSVPVPAGIVKYELLFKERPESAVSARRAGQGRPIQRAAAQ